MRKSEKLIRRLQREGLITKTQAEGSEVRRTYAGRSQRSEGAWSWYLVDSQGRELFTGSHFSVTELLQSRNWEFGDDGTIYREGLS